MMNRNKAFTLLEMLVAISIFGIIGVMGFSGLMQVTRSGEQITQVQQQLADIQFALGYLQRDFLQLAERKIRDQYGDTQHQLILADGQLTLTRAGWSNLLQQPRSNLQRVRYQLSEDNELIRSYWPQLDQPYEESRIDQPLLQNVESFSLHFISQNRKEIEKWPLEEDNNNSDIPVAFQVDMDINGLGEISRVFEVSSELL